MSYTAIETSHYEVVTPAIQWVLNAHAPRGPADQQFRPDCLALSLMRRQVVGAGLDQTAGAPHPPA